MYIIPQSTLKCIGCIFYTYFYERMWYYGKKEKGGTTKRACEAADL